MEFVSKVLALITAIKAKDFKQVVLLVSELLALLAPLVPTPKPVFGASDEDELTKLTAELETQCAELQRMHAAGDEKAGAFPVFLIPIILQILSLFLKK